MYTDIVNNKWTETKLTFQDGLNPSLFITTPRVGGTCLTVEPTYHAITTRKISVYIKQYLAFELWVHQE